MNDRSGDQKQRVAHSLDQLSEILAPKNEPSSPPSAQPTGINPKPKRRSDTHKQEHGIPRVLDLITSDRQQRIGKNLEKRLQDAWSSSFQKLEQQQQELAAEKQRLAQLEGELRNTISAEIRQELKTRSAAIEEKETLLQGHEEDLLAWEKSVRESESEVTRRNQIIRALEEGLETRDTLLATRSQRLEEKARQLKQEKSRHNTLTKQLATREDRLSNIEKELKAFEAKKKRLLTRIKTREANCTDLEEPLKELRKKLKQARNQVHETRNEAEQALAAAAAQRRKLQAELRSVRSQLAEQEEQAEEFEQAALKAEDRHRRLKRELEARGIFELSDEDLIDWLTEGRIEGFDDEFIPPDDVTILGAGPLAEDQMARHLHNWGCQAWNQDCEWIILGREHWTPGEVDELLRDHPYESIRIVSQEMFVASVLSGRDVLDAPAELLLAFATGHPALEYLIKAGFEWPFFTEQLPEQIAFFLSTGADESPLAALGYHVGRTQGLPVRHRRSLLWKSYTDAIPWVESNDYMAEWGAPSTRRRLWRIAHHLSRLIRARRSIRSMDRAVEDWYEDLIWLEEQFYRPWMSFKWPSVRI